MSSDSRTNSAREIVNTALTIGGNVVGTISPTVAASPEFQAGIAIGKAALDFLIGLFGYDAVMVKMREGGIMIVEGELDPNSFTVRYTEDGTVIEAN